MDGYNKIYFKPDVINRQEVNNLVDELEKAISYERCFMPIGRSTTDIIHDILNLPSVTPQPNVGHWICENKVEGVYDEAGVKTWGIKCHCDKCNFTTTVIENFGYYKYCPNCGAKMVELQESEDRK